MKYYKVVVEDKVDVLGNHFGPCVLCHVSMFGPLLLPRPTAENKAAILNENMAWRYAEAFEGKLEFVREDSEEAPHYTDWQFPKFASDNLKCSHCFGPWNYNEQSGQRHCSKCGYVQHD